VIEKSLAGKRPLNRKYNSTSFLLAVLGAGMMYVGLIYFQYLSILIPGVLLFILSLVAGVVAIIKRERGLLKFVPFILLIPIIPFVMFLFSGQI